MKFTFHYGQIYYYFIIICCSRKSHLHSTMVRFIIRLIDEQKFKDITFTFHYGQIYYDDVSFVNNIFCGIYIPLWLDLLSIALLEAIEKYEDLHSTMVRFIIQKFNFNFKLVKRFTFHYGQIYYFFIGGEVERDASIYIPLWLDLLCDLVRAILLQNRNLHSTMVRFIIREA